MDFIDENANISLFLIVIFVIVIFLALTVFYQESFSDINERYNKQVKELNKTFADLVAAKSKISDTEQNLQLKERREEDLSNTYTKTKSERDILELDKTKLLQQVNELNQQVNYLNATVRQLNDVLGTKEEKINELEALVDSLKDRIDCLKAGNANC